MILVGGLFSFEVLYGGGIIWFAGLFGPKGLVFWMEKGMVMLGFVVYISPFSRVGGGVKLILPRLAQPRLWISSVGVLV